MRIFLKASLILSVSAVVCLCGCQENNLSDKMSGDKPEFKTFYTSKPVIVDGLLDDKVWEKAVEYKLNLSRDKSGKVVENAKVKFAWDENYFYLAANLQDSDIVAENLQDQQHHYKFGDLCELFLKPVENTCYWELYSTPAGNKTTFFFFNKESLSDPRSFTDYISGLIVASKVQGTLNSRDDKDSGWTTEMAMPVKDLIQHGNSFGLGSKWTILVGRYNYNKYLEDTELSMAPQLSKNSYHLTDEYAKLVFIK